jgi:very-short-patch-repair endonuclease
MLRNIPITSPVRTLIDLAGVAPGHVVEAALANAIVERRITAKVLSKRLAQMSRKGVAGPPVLRRLLLQSFDRVHAISPLERRLADVLRCTELPPFCREHPVYVDRGVYYLDFAWPHLRVGVEADSRRWHSDGRSFERDRERDNALTAAGWRMLRVTDYQVRSDPGAVRDWVRSLLVRG